MSFLVRFDFKPDQDLGLFVPLHDCQFQREGTSGNKDLGGGRVLLPGRQQRGPPSTQGYDVVMSPVTVACKCFQASSC